MEIARLTTTEQWESLAANWGGIARGNPFASWEWLSAWWRHYGGGQELCVLAVLDDKCHVVGAAPWYASTSGARGTVLKTLGSGEVCSEYVGLLSRSGCESGVARAVAGWLAERHDAVASDGFQWDLLSFECIPVTDRVTGELIERLAHAGCAVQHQPATCCWRIPLPDTWEAYLAELSKSHRKQLQRALRSQYATGRAQLRIIPPGESPREGLEILMSLHTRRWRSQGGGGVFTSPRFAAFLRDVVSRMHPLGTLQLSVLELDGRPAAADVHLLSKTASYAYQGGIEPELAGESPGRLLTALLIRRAIENGHREFDFLRGDEPYKPHFRAVPTITHHIQSVPPRAAAQIRHGIWLAGATVKKWVKSGVSLASRH